MNCFRACLFFHDFVFSSICSSFLVSCLIRCVNRVGRVTNFHVCVCRSFVLCSCCWCVVHVVSCGSTCLCARCCCCCVLCRGVPVRLAYVLLRVCLCCLQKENGVAARRDMSHSINWLKRMSGQYWLYTVFEVSFYLYSDSHRILVSIIFTLFLFVNYFFSVAFFERF